MSYEPDPTSVAGRVIRYLATKPAGYLAPTTELSRELGVPTNSFSACLTASINAGLVAKRSVDELGRYVGFALGPAYVPVSVVIEQLTGDDSTPPPPAAAAEPAGQEVTALLEVAQSVRDAISTDPVTQEIKALMDMRDAEPEFACALFNDGRLYLELGEERMTLQLPQTRALFAYLERVALP